jgi:hypothetical protein
LNSFEFELYSNRATGTVLAGPAGQCPITTLPRSSLSLTYPGCCHRALTPPGPACQSRSAASPVPRCSPLFPRSALPTFTALRSVPRPGPSSPRADQTPPPHHIASCLHIPAPPILLSLHFSSSCPSALPPLPLSRAPDGSLPPHPL